MAYGSALVDNIQSSTANTPVVFKDGNGTQIGTLCRAWVNFNGTGGTIRSSFNVSSITVNGTGNYTVNFATTLNNANYAAVCGVSVMASTPDSKNIITTGSETTTYGPHSTTALGLITTSIGAGIANNVESIQVAIFD